MRSEPAGRSGAGLHRAAVAALLVLTGLYMWTDWQKRAGADKIVRRAHVVLTSPSGPGVRPQLPLPPREYAERLQQMARRVDFPLFAPRWLPPGYVPLRPLLHPYGAELAYAPVSEAGTASPETPRSLNIMERRAAPSDAARVPERSEPIGVDGAFGWFDQGERGPGGFGSGSLLTLMRDGTWIAISSFDLNKTEMLRLALSLKPVPGGRPPLPNPVPRTLAGVRQRVSFPVFVPTDMPAGLTPEPPDGGEQAYEPVHITYHTPAGAVALRALSGPAGCCLAADPRKTGESVLVKGSIPAHFLSIRPEFGGHILWWEEAGSYVALSGPHLTRAQLLKIAASMSGTADLGRTQLPTARPKPPPVPPPRFRLLRPTWLPEPAAVWVEFLPGPPEYGSDVRLSFDPHPGDKPHGVLELRELPAGGSADMPARDPQATREKIGGRDVTVMRRGGRCVVLSWVQDGVALTLTNPYDPPGELRYSCSQLRKIVQSTR